MIDCVLPIKKSDLGRFLNLHSTIEKYFKCEGTIYVITLDKEFAHIGNYFKQIGKPYSVFPEGEIAPCFRSGGTKLPGWWKQQLLKIAIVDKVQTPYYLTLDADCLIVREIHEGDLIRGGKGRVQYTGNEYFPQWYVKSCDVLRVKKRPENAVMVTPFLFSTTIVKSLVGRLCEIKAPRFSHWTNYLASRIGWSEYSLYHTWGVHIGLWETHHESKSSHLIGNSIWKPDEVLKWEARNSFEQEKFLFSVIQSTAGLSAAWVRDRIGAYTL